MDCLREAADDGNRKYIASIIHRIKPVWEMFGLSAILLPLENAAKDKTSTKVGIRPLVEEVLMAMDNLLVNIKDEIDIMTYEEQDTDC